MAEIKREDLDRLAHLSRLNLTEEEEAGFSNDFSKILAHFEELSELKPRLAGTKAEKQVLRSDKDDMSRNFKHQDELRNDFPSRKEDYLVVPPVFDKE